MSTTPTSLSGIFTTSSYGGTVFVRCLIIYSLVPQVHGRMLNEHLGRACTFALTFMVSNLCFAPQHWLGLNGMPRRVAEYDPQFTM